MGYESKLYVVEKPNLKYIDNDGMVYCQIIAMLDLCRFPALSDRLAAYPDTKCYFYADDGNTKVLSDNYGDALKEIPLADVINTLETELKKGETYRRIYPVLAALKSLEEHKDQWREVVVLHYGY